ncbi:MAG: HD domain-containing protein [Bdellovibrionales bacterium]|nr:HD domain-containing protein [Bdellovibrionales bacterium]
MRDNPSSLRPQSLAETCTVETIDLEDSTTLSQFIFDRFDPPRRDHILAVAEQCKLMASTIASRNPALQLDSDEAFRAGLLHDIGYLAEVKAYIKTHNIYAVTGWHPIDGANYLRLRGAHRLADLIEGHGNSAEMAEMLGVGPVSISDDLVATIVTIADCNTGPTGDKVSYEERLREIHARGNKDALQAYEAHMRARNRILLLQSSIQQLLGEPHA